MTDHDHIYRLAKAARDEQPNECAKWNDFIEACTPQAIIDLCERADTAFERGLVEGRKQGRILARAVPITKDI